MTSSGGLCLLSWPRRKAMIEVEVLVYLSFFFPSLFPSLMSCLVMGSASDFCLFSFLFLFFTLSERNQRTTQGSDGEWCTTFFSSSFCLLFSFWFPAVATYGRLEHFLTITFSQQGGMENALVWPSVFGLFCVPRVG